jgi:pyruvate dehydrogenase E1 component
LEGRFRGSGWNVIKILWGCMWDDLFARDSDGVLANRLQELVDGDEQRIFTSDATTFKNELFNTPHLKAMVSHLSDEDLEALASNLGGHDMVKINAAYAAAEACDDKPTVILARTIKGYGLGPAFAGRNSTHGKKKADEDSIKWMRDDLNLGFTDEELKEYPFIEPKDIPEVVSYLKQRREEMGGFCPERRAPPTGLTPPGIEGYSSFDEGTKGKMQVSTTMAFVRLLSGLMKDKKIGQRVVPIVPDEARTFGMDPLFAQFGIYHPDGQLYTPVDHKVLMKYKESEKGQLFEEGISEAGAMSTFIASATSYSTQGCATIPFYIFYSMFGFQRVGDLIWSASDQRARGFMIGATSGRTTLNGEGLQHQDGHSLLMAHTNPAVRAYDPAFAYELATIIRSGIDEMYVDEKDLMYYIAVYNENHPMPPKPAGVDEGIVKGAYKLRSAPKGEGPIVRLIGSGPIMLQLLSAVEVLETYGVRSEIWSATSYGELRREGLDCERENRLNPTSARQVPYVEQMLGDGTIPTIAVSDNQIAVPDMIRQWVGGDYTVLGTDGFGRSDTRANLRRFFEIDAQHITLAALSSLVRSKDIESEVYDKAIKELGISKERNDITAL